MSSSNRDIQAKIRDSMGQQTKKEKRAGIDMTKMQMTLKNNSEDIQYYMKDLEGWQKDIKQKDQFTHVRAKKPTTKAEKAKAAVPLPPIRNKVQVDKYKQKKGGDIFDKDDIKKNSKKVEMEAKNLKRDTTPMFNYYKDWDKYADEALAEFDENEKEESSDDDETIAKNPKFEEEDAPANQAEMMRLTSGAKPNTKLIIKGGTIQKNSMADQLKAQGNAFFVSLEFEKAIDCYTRCIPQVPESDHTMRTVVYSNRAQCYIKLEKYDNAYNDADKALSYDPSHIKSLQRRATSAYYTKRLRQARKDFMHCLSIEFTDQFNDNLAKVLQQIEKAKLAAHEKLTRQVVFNSGVNFHANKDPDLAKKEGIDSFKLQSFSVETKEMNLDPEQIKQMKAKKEEMLKILKRSQDDHQDFEFRSKEKDVKQVKPVNAEENLDERPETKKEKKKNKKSKKDKKQKKGINAFLDDNQDAKDFEDNEIDRINSKTDENDDKDEMKGSSLVQEIDAAPASVEKISETVQQSEEAATQDDDEWVDESDYKQYEKKSDGKPKGLLMKNNEFNTTKNVTIDEDANVVKEFLKSQKIEKGNPKKAAEEKAKQSEKKDVAAIVKEELKGKKAKKQKQKEKREAIKSGGKKNKDVEATSSNSENQENAESKENESVKSNTAAKDDVQTKKSLRDYSDIKDLQKSDTVIQARDRTILAQAPKNYYSFERDFKSLKSEPDKLCKYLMIIKKEDIKKIFKSDLETDILLALYSNLLSQNDEFYQENWQDVQDFVEGLSAVEPFNMACEFLMDDEKETIKKLILRIEKNSFDADGMKKVMNAYSKKCQIDF